MRWRQWRGDNPNALTDESELLIDGYPSSGNSYVRAWIHFANPAARIASHEHAPAVVTAAVRRGIPTIVPFREPVDAITSLLTRFARFRVTPPYGARRLLRWYVRYHEGVLAHRGDVLLVPFEAATADLTPAIEAINARFGTTFAALPEPAWPDVVDYLRTKDADDETDELSVSVPSEAKERAKADHRAELLSDALAAERRAAQAIHAEALSASMR